MNCIVSAEPYLAAISKLPQELFSCALPCIVAKVSSFTGQVSSTLFLQNKYFDQVSSTLFFVQTLMLLFVEGTQ